MNVPIKTLIAAIVLAAIALPAAASAAKGPALTCGSTVYTDVTLKQDIDCSAGGDGGLLVGADDITIDLNGHSITGAGATDGYEGIENGGFDRVTIKNGTISAFKDNLYLSNVAKNRILNLKLKSGPNDESNGVYSSYGTGNRFAGNKISYANYAFQFVNGSQNTVVDNKIVKPERGVFTTNEAFDQIKRNDVAGFSITTYGYWSDGDFRMSFTKNVVDGGYEGFYVNAPRGVVIDHSKANNIGYAGIYINGSAANGDTAKVTKSVANDNAEYGIYSTFGITSWGNTATGNEFYNCHLAACNG